MNTETLTVYDTPWVTPPDEVEAAALRQFAAQLPADEQAISPPDRGSPSLKSVMDDFVRLVEDNAKVWAVYASQEGSVIHVWTYVDSTVRGDRSPVYSAEWKLLTRYPQIGFDFNVPLVPVDGEQFEVDEAAYLYRR